MSSNLKKIAVQQKALLAAHRTNYRGKKTTDRYLLIESDDWGAVRTPSKSVIDIFKNKGINLAGSIYQNDSLASAADLEALFNVLTAFKDAGGHPLKLTANAIVANPDFDKIRESGYREYHYETFTDTFRRYPEHQGNFELWKQGMKAGIFQPQFHGREHLQVRRWLKALQADSHHARFCFGYRTTFSGYGDYSFMEAYDWDHRNEVTSQAAVIADGLSIFRKTFGFESRSFIAPCYNWDTKLEPGLYENGIRIVQGLRIQLAPTGTFDRYRPIPHRFGEKNRNGLCFNIRNAFLEPSLNPSKDWVDSCLAQIASAFFWQKPAVICSHRINYVGFINPANRDRGLRDLEALITQVLKRWPDVRFISTDELVEVLGVRDEG